MLCYLFLHFDLVRCLFIVTDNKRTFYQDKWRQILQLNKINFVNMYAVGPLCMYVCWKKEGLSRDSNPGPPAPKAGIMPLDH